MKIVRTNVYLRQVKKLKASERDIEALEQAIAANPAAGDVIPGLDGVRKLRFAMGGKGKRGGGRAIYYVLWVDDTAFMIMAYAKSEREDLSEAGKKIIRALIREINT